MQRSWTGCCWMEISRQIFRIENTGEKLCQKLAQIFGSLITSDPIFSMPFEQEMQTRLNTMSGEDRVLMVKNMLEERRRQSMPENWILTAAPSPCRRTTISRTAG